MKENFTYVSKLIPQKAFDRLYNFILHNAIFTEESEWIISTDSNGNIWCDTCTKERVVHFRIGGNTISIDNYGTNSVHYYSGWCENYKSEVRKI